MVQRTQAVYADGRWNGKTLREWAPEAVDDIVKATDPVRVILFGSVANGEEGPDSDLDFLVVLDEVGREDRTRLMGEIRFAISAPAPIDIFVTDPQECERRKNVIGSMHYWALREGVVVYERVA
jgi:predicted nucleotidyltransferase